MAQTPVRTPDGYNRIGGGGGADTPTPDLIVATFPDALNFNLIGSGISVEDTASIQDIGLAGFGFTDAEAIASLSLDPIPGPPPPAVPAVVTPGSVVATSPAGPVAGTIICDLTGAGNGNSAGFYTLSVTTTAGKTGCVRVEITPPA